MAAFVVTASLHADLVFATHVTTALSYSLFLVINSHKLDYFLNDRNPGFDATSYVELQHADAAGNPPDSKDFTFSYSFALELLHLRHDFLPFLRKWVLLKILHYLEAPYFWVQHHFIAQVTHVAHNSTELLNFDSVALKSW